MTDRPTPGQITRWFLEEFRAEQHMTAADGSHALLDLLTGTHDYRIVHSDDATIIYKQTDTDPELNWED